jgi:hypothetical protein
MPQTINSIQDSNSLFTTIFRKAYVWLPTHVRKCCDRTCPGPVNVFDDSSDEDLEEDLEEEESDLRQEKRSIAVKRRATRSNLVRNRRVSHAPLQKAS